MKDPLKQKFLKMAGLLSQKMEKGKSEFKASFFFLSRGDLTTNPGRIGRGWHAQVVHSLIYGLYWYVLP